METTLILTEDQLNSLSYEDGSWPDWENPEFETEHLEGTYTDLGKGYSDMELVVRRVSDNTYWKGKYVKSSMDKYFDNKTFKLVVKKEVTTTIYE